jgi:hypothetical protein
MQQFGASALIEVQENGLKVEGDCDLARAMLQLALSQASSDRRRDDLLTWAGPPFS